MNPEEANTILTVYGLTIVLCVYGFIRNQWLFIERVRILDEDFEVFKARNYTGPMSPRYDQIESLFTRQFWSFWIWDINHWIK